jgi:hypothetical protein
MSGKGQSKRPLGSDNQNEIFDLVKRERSIVEGNRELIRVYEEKVKKVIERVWES